MKKQVFWGILAALGGAALLLLAIFPQFSPFGFAPLWKWLLGALILWWLFSNLFFGKNLVQHFKIFLPLGLLFILFEKEIAPFFGKEADFVNNWLVMGAALLLTAAVWLLLGKRTITVHKQCKKTVDGREEVIDETEEIPFEEVTGAFHKDGDEDGYNRINRFSSTVAYLDASDPTLQRVKNKLGDMAVCYENTDVGDGTAPVLLEVNNELGNLGITIPADWTVTMNVESSLGNAEYRPNPENPGRPFRITGINRLGNLGIVS